MLLAGGSTPMGDYFQSTDAMMCFLAFKIICVLNSEGYYFI